MIDDVAKQGLQQTLQWTREALVWKLDGLSEYEVRRPMTATGTNLLGLVKHAATWEARYFGEVFDRPLPEQLPNWEDSVDGSDLWVTEDESREQVIGFYRRVWAHANATVAGLALDAPGHVPWWTRPDVTLFSVMVHVLSDTTRHAGHADILREQVDGHTGVSRAQQEPIDAAAREARCRRIEMAAANAARNQG